MKTALALLVAAALIIYGAALRSHRVRVSSKGKPPRFELQSEATVIEATTIDAIRRAADGELEGTAAGSLETTGKECPT